MAHIIETTRLVTLLAVLAVATTARSAEEVPPPDDGFIAGGNSPQDLVVEEDIVADSVGPNIGYESAAFDLWDGMPSPVESTGTWLRRGWWSAEIDAVVMIRKWDRQNLILGFDNSTNPSRILRVGRTSPAEASARLNLGRFLFRDSHNRDHTGEFIVMGGNEFFHTSIVEGNDPNSTFVNAFLDMGSDATFDGADSMAVGYASRLNNFELNYKVTSRMSRDRMELQPDGQWVRRAAPSFTYHAIGGMRYTDLTEVLNWTATDIVNVAGTTVFTGDNGYYQIETSNDMFGFQGGAGARYEADRWSLEFFAKGAIMMNDAKAYSLLEFTDPVSGVARTDVGFTKRDRTGTLPLFTHCGLVGRYHIRPNVSVKAGYEFMYMTAVALATHQIDFRPIDDKVSATATPFYHGISLGGEFYW